MFSWLKTRRDRRYSTQSSLQERRTFRPGADSLEAREVLSTFSLAGSVVTPVRVGETSAAQLNVETHPSVSPIHVGTLATSKTVAHVVNQTVSLAPVTTSMVSDHARTGLNHTRDVDQPRATSTATANAVATTATLNKTLPHLPGFTATLPHLPGFTATLPHLPGFNPNIPVSSSQSRSTQTVSTTALNGGTILSGLSTTQSINLNLGTSPPVSTDILNNGTFIGSGAATVSPSLGSGSLTVGTSGTGKSRSPCKV